MEKKVWIFTTTTCAPCKMLKKQVELFPDLKAGVTYQNMDENAASELAREMCIHKAPTVVLLQDGKPMDTVDGSMTAMLAAVVSHLS